MLSNGLKAQFSLVREGDGFQAALYVNGRLIRGPSLPSPLNPPKGDVTHWMGNHPSVGLTAEEAEKILSEVEVENSVREHRLKSHFE